MRDWQTDAPKMIAAIHAELPSEATPDDLRKELRKRAYEFHHGTSWGKKVWAKHCKAYVTKLLGGSNQAIAKHEWPADIFFPFRDTTSQTQAPAIPSRVYPDIIPRRG